jgi:hypothetical protein
MIENELPERMWLDLQLVEPVGISDKVHSRNFMIEFAIVSEYELEAAWLRALHLVIMAEFLDHYKCLAVILVTGTL